MKKVLGVFCGLIALIIVACIGVLITADDGLFKEGNPLEQFASDTKASLVNAAIDASGVKNTIHQELTARTSDIAQATGMTETQVSSAINDLAIDEWTATTLPSTTTPTATYDGSNFGVDGVLTTYDDPSYVTVEAYGQTITFDVPASAQAYLPYLGYLA